MKDVSELLYEFYLNNPMIITDSRKACPNSIFFALKGEHFDGNEYAAKALECGSAIAVVSDYKLIEKFRLPDEAGHAYSDSTTAYGQYGQFFYVPDVLVALQLLAAYHRKAMRQWKRPTTIIGITGTNGKTTTKELIKSVLTQKYNILATEGNYNNQLGVPLMMLKITPEHDFAVIEMGANHPTDIEDLCKIVEPDYGLITNVGVAHLLGFGSFEGVVKAKTALYRSLEKQNGVAFVNASDVDLASKLKGKLAISYTADKEHVTYGMVPIPKVRGEELSVAPYLKLRLTIVGQGEEIIQTHLIGGYNINNVVAAACIGYQFGIGIEQIRTAIEGYEPVNMRSQLIELSDDRSLILDAYNANPSSMVAALNSLFKNPARHKSVILGDMLELGKNSIREHTKILNMLCDCGFEHVYLVGAEFYETYAQALRNTDKDKLREVATQISVQAYRDVASLCSDVNSLQVLHGSILIKGSRGVALEKVVEVFKTL